MFKIFGPWKPCSRCEHQWNHCLTLGAAINVMTKDTMLKLNLQGSLRKTTRILQLADRSIVTLEGIVGDVMVSIES